MCKCSFLRGLGVQFLSQDTTDLPASLPAGLPTVDKRFIPPLEYRAQLMYSLDGGTDSAPAAWVRIHTQPAVCLCFPGGF